MTDLIKNQRNKFGARFFLLIAHAIILLMSASACLAEDARQSMFERLFGDLVRLDPAKVEKVKSLPAGQQLLVDTNGDGIHDEAWFMDTDKRHTIQPILVRVIDEDGDLDADGPDRDSDLYIADWKADGKVDVIIDYQDNDGDDDIDEVIRYEWFEKYYGLGKPGIKASWTSDDGDDNLLRWDVDWKYYQKLCQYRCHYSGNESFMVFLLPEDGDKWISCWENPFIFYDVDGDGSSEIALRNEGVNDEVHNLRYSFDADGDAWGERPYDYDFSISAWSGQSDGGWAIKLTDDITTQIKLRGVETHRFLRRDVARQFVRQAPWVNECLTWDEMNANTQKKPDMDPHERWEGVIAYSSPNFKNIGGPSCSFFNKRNEVSTKPVHPMRLYYDSSDHRLHLLGANEGWINVDYDLDDKLDARYTYIDENQDGVFDRRQIDLDGDGKAEFDWPMAGNSQELELDYESISHFYKQQLTSVLEASQKFIDAAKAMLAEELTAPDPVELFFLEKLSSWYPTTKLGERMRSTPAGARYYVDLLRDRLFYRLKNKLNQQPAWNQLEAAYAAGRYDEAAGLLQEKLTAQTPIKSPLSYRAFSWRLPILIDNTAGKQRENWPVTLKLKDLKNAAENINLKNCAMVAPDRWIDWRQIPHQVDQLDEQTGEEISFLVDVPEDSSVTYYLYYSPTGEAHDTFAPQTATWDPAENNIIGWESTVTAYRAYRGQFDFFGKSQYDYSVKRLGYLLYPDMKKSNYHQQADWGMDALHVNKTSGLGGLTLSLAGRDYLVQNPTSKDKQVKFTKKPLASGPVRAAVEFVAENIIPENPDFALKVLCLIYAEHQESEIRVSTKDSNQAMFLAPGLCKLTHEKNFVDNSQGCLGVWGWQDPKIGTVGLALIVPPDKLVEPMELKDERRLRCDFSRGELRYWIIGDWLKGREFPVEPTITNWQQQVTSLAQLLHHDVKMVLGKCQQIP